MITVHLILQGQHNVGKSFIATVLAQYQHFKGQTLLCFDIDPLKASFARVKALNVQPLDLLENDQINRSKTERLMQTINAAATDVIIDTPAPCFIPLCESLVRENRISALQALGHRLIVHLILMGGEAFYETVHDFAHAMCSWPQESPVILWLNPHGGPLKEAGKEFEQMKVYKDYKHRLTALSVV